MVCFHQRYNTKMNHLPCSFYPVEIAIGSMEITECTTDFSLYIFDYQVMNKSQTKVRITLDTLW